MAYPLLLLSVSLLPALFWLYIFYQLDQEKEPWSLVLLGFFLGALMVFPAAILEAPFSLLFMREGPLLLLLTFLLGFFEEGLKLLPILLFLYPREEFNEICDGILYMMAAGLGFAFLENLFYSFVYGLPVLLVRAFLTTLAHGTFSGISGFYVGKSRFHEGQSLTLILGGLLRASILHGTYNYLLLGGILSLPYLVVSILLLQVYLFYLIQSAQCTDPV